MTACARRWISAEAAENSESWKLTFNLNERIGTDPEDLCRYSYGIEEVDPTLFYLLRIAFAGDKLAPEAEWVHRKAAVGILADVIIPVASVEVREKIWTVFMADFEAITDLLDDRISRAAWWIYESMAANGGHDFFVKLEINEDRLQCYLSREWGRELDRDYLDRAFAAWKGGVFESDMPYEDRTGGIPSYVRDIACLTGNREAFELWMEFGFWGSFLPKWKRIGETLLKFPALMAVFERMLFENRVLNWTFIQFLNCLEEFSGLKAMISERLLNEIAVRRITEFDPAHRERCRIALGLFNKEGGSE
jgi:hypothetical protein